MPELFTAKVRKVGTSLGVLIPKEYAVQENIKEGQEIEIGIVKRQKLEEVLRLFGSAKYAEPFEREKVDRI